MTTNGTVAGERAGLALSPEAARQGAIKSLRRRKAALRPLSLSDATLRAKAP